MTQPVLLAVDDDPDDLATIAGELRRRYGADYQVVCEPSAADGLSALERALALGQRVAVVLADLRMPGMDGVEFLRHAARLHPDARRVLLIDWGDRQAGEVVLPAQGMGEVDDWISKPWVRADEHFHQAVSGFLYAWAQTHRPHFEAVQVVAERWSARSHELRDVLSRNNVMFGFHSSDSTEGRLLLRQVGLDVPRLPVVITYDGQVLVQPTNSEIAATLGIRTRPDPHVIHDVLIVGAGPSGIAAAVYAASEGLHVAGIEREAIGGQAASSSLIRNYPGFPRGISGTELTARAFQQAGSFGAEIVYGAARRLRAEGSFRIVDLGDVGEMRGRAVLLATGVSYRTLTIASLERLVGRGVFYGAAASEAPAMRDREVCVVGGANSAGQAALHLARYAGHVTILVRRPTLTETMSDYLIRQIDATPNIVVRHETQAVGGHGTDQLTGLTLHDRRIGRQEDVRADALFVLIGAEPHTAWLPEEIRRDQQGFILTGSDLLSDGDRPPGWSLQRPPGIFETSLPGVFAIGDVRHGSVKRVASSVGEGSVAARLLHDYLSRDA